MRITQSVSFWIIVFSAILGFIVGQLHWILGVLFFLILAGKTAMIGLILDTVSGSLEYHHDRQDSRMKKIFESIAAMRSTPPVITPDTKSVPKIINIRR
jgi:hypothetical protein